MGLARAAERSLGAPRDQIVIVDPVKADYTS